MRRISQSWCFNDEHAGTFMQSNPNKYVNVGYLYHVYDRDFDVNNDTYVIFLSQTDDYQDS